MTVLLLSPYPEQAAKILADTDEVIVRDTPVTPADVRTLRADWLVSFGYRHLLPADVLDAVGGRAVNLHMSVLPWNRGAHPNLWSVVEDTPKGASLHLIDPGIDTGAILAQRSVDVDPAATLRTSYARLSALLVELLADAWPALRAGRLAGQPQDPSAGTYHSSRDLERVWPHLNAGWDTPICEVPRARDLPPRVPARAEDTLGSEV
jgi:methionyl-tRNA formyltransferase